MNCLFDEYKNAGVRGKKIDIENGAEIFVKWIIQVYRNKGVRFFITNNYNIVPIGDFGTYFDVTASYRVKRSGSSKVPKKNMKSVIDYVVDSKFDIFEHNEKGKKLYVKSKQALNKVKFSLNGLEYMFSGVADEFEIRKLSNTNNANVIFSVKYKNKQGISENEFIDFLK
jgi:hypothetical protein